MGPFPRSWALPPLAAEPPPPRPRRVRPPVSAVSARAGRDGRGLLPDRKGIRRGLLRPHRARHPPHPPTTPSTYTRQPPPSNHQATTRQPRPAGSHLPVQRRALPGGVPHEAHAAARRPPPPLPPSPLPLRPSAARSPEIHPRIPLPPPPARRVFSARGTTSDNSDSCSCPCHSFSKKSAQPGGRSLAQELPNAPPLALGAGQPRGNRRPKSLRAARGTRSDNSDSRSGAIPGRKWPQSQGHGALPRLMADAAARQLWPMTPAAVFWYV